MLLEKTTINIWFWKPESAYRIDISNFFELSDQRVGNRITKITASCYYTNYAFT